MYTVYPILLCTFTDAWSGDCQVELYRERHYILQGQWLLYGVRFSDPSAWSGGCESELSIFIWATWARKHSRGCLGRKRSVPRYRRYRKSKPTSGKKKKDNIFILFISAAPATLKFTTQHYTRCRYRSIFHWHCTIRGTHHSSVKLL